ncbi:twin transmembrane helix small protein [Kordiimonas pumila]|uniref:Twin transmembrane helix small protein n=1 Tax=Kordiimonas pumila TaxID=2161677 RepID=A0ABV7D0A7_9PROT|nr:twin transmembrane helix small protein [Kordiimonas pumila]
MKVLFTLAILSAIATLVVLIMGVMTMGRDKGANKNRGNKMMRLRVFFQFTTLVFLLLAALAASTGS